MSEYASIDSVIENWVEATGSTLFTDWAGAPARFFYVPGDPPFECFQVCVAPPSDGRVSVIARAVDTNDDTDEDMSQSWEGPLDQISDMLRIALATIDEWKARQRIKLDPPSPW